MLLLIAALCLHRFGSFEIFKRADEHTGRQGPSYGRDEIRGQMLDYVIEMFYPEIQQNCPDRVERNVSFFREVRRPTSDCKPFCSPSCVYSVGVDIGNSQNRLHPLILLSPETDRTNAESLCPLLSI